MNCNVDEWKNIRYLELFYQITFPKVMLVTSMSKITTPTSNIRYSERVHVHIYMYIKEGEM